MSNEDWIINIENAAATAISFFGKEAVQHVFKKYGAYSAEDLTPTHYSEVFDELDFMAHDACD